MGEPTPNGGRINLGSDGGTAYATKSPQTLVQVLSPSGLEKFVVGQTVDLQWRSDGLSAVKPVLLINAGNGGAVGDYLANTDQTAGFNNGSFSNSVDVSGVTDPAPQAVYQSYVSASYGVGNTIGYQLPAPDGTHTIRLDFADPNASYEGQRVFDVQLQGSTVESGYDIYAAAGDADFKATELTFTGTATGGQGISLDLVNDTDYPALLSGIEVTATNPSGTADRRSTWLIRPMAKPTGRQSRRV